MRNIAIIVVTIVCVSIRVCSYPTTTLDCSTKFVFKVLETATVVPICISRAHNLLIRIGTEPRTTDVSITRLHPDRSDKRPRVLAYCLARLEALPAEGCFIECFCLFA